VWRDVARDVAIPAAEIFGVRMRGSGALIPFAPQEFELGGSRTRCHLIYCKDQQQVVGE
jgi:hypothetical protein